METQTLAAREEQEKRAPKHRTPVQLVSRANFTSACGAGSRKWFAARSVASTARITRTTQIDAVKVRARHPVATGVLCFGARFSCSSRAANVCVSIFVLPSKTMV